MKLPPHAMQLVGVSVAHLIESGANIYKAQSAFPPEACSIKHEASFYSLYEHHMFP